MNPQKARAEDLVRVGFGWPGRGAGGGCTGQWLHSRHYVLGGGGREDLIKIPLLILLVWKPQKSDWNNKVSAVIYVGIPISVS